MCRKLLTALALSAFLLSAAAPESCAGVRGLLRKLDAAAPSEKTLLIRAWEALYSTPLAPALAEALGRIGDIKAIPYLRRGMADEDPRVVQKSVEALGRIRDMRSVDWMIGLLSSSDQNTARTSLASLGFYSPP